jgi:hypothetical protein
MATISAVLVPSVDKKFLKVKWETVTATDNVGAAVEMGAFRDRSVQVIGDFGTGGTLVIEGSNDGGTTYATLTDPQGNALSFTAAGLEAITEMVGHIRPRLSAGSGTVDLDVYMFLGGNQD